MFFQLHYRFEGLVAGLEVQLESKKSLDEEKKLAILREKKIIGMTITGAAINSSLIQKLGPKVVLVEEAAEILEPCLIAAISSSTSSWSGITSSCGQVLTPTN